MRAKIYPIRPKQAQRHLHNLAMIILNFATVIWALTGYKDIIHHDDAMVSLVLNLGLFFLVLGVVYGILKITLTPKINKISLIIDDKGIRTNSKWFNKFPNINSIEFYQIDKVDYTENLAVETAGKLLHKVEPDLKRFNKCLIIHATKKERMVKVKRQLMIDEYVWQIDDFDELMEIFAKRGHTPTLIANQTYIKENLPQAQDLGKRAGHLAYASVAVMILAGGLIYLDDFITLDFGYMSSIYVGVATLIAMLGANYIYHENHDFKGMVVLPIFVPMATFLVFALMLLVSPVIGKKEPMTFTLLHDKTWQAQYKQKPLDIKCKQNLIQTKSDGKVVIVETLGMVRIGFEEIDKLCVK